MSKILQAIIEGLMFSGVMTLTLSLVYKDPVKSIISLSAWLIIYVAAYLLMIHFNKNEEARAESDKTRKAFIKSMLNSIVDYLSDICYNVAVEYKGAEDFKITFRVDNITRVAIESVILPEKGHYTSEDMQDLITQNINIAKQTIGLN